MDQSIGRELDGIDLGDERLNRRSRNVLEALAVDPQLSINAACQTWSETLAASPPSRSSMAADGTIQTGTMGMNRKPDKHWT